MDNDTPHTEELPGIPTEEPPENLISEVECNQRPGNVDMDGNVWKMIMEQQNKNLMALLEVVKPQVATTSAQITLPEFNPDKANVDARSWVSTADLCVTDARVHGAPLMMALSRALKGDASTWLLQISFAGMTWADFKQMFLARFDCSDTAAAFLINLSSSKPNENECLSAYAARLMTSLMSRWRELSTEQIAVATIMSHIAHIEPRVQRLAFTIDITTRSEMQRELKAVTFLRKRSNPNRDDHVEPEGKRFKPVSSPVLKCYNCGNVGHQAIACRFKKDNRLNISSAGTSSNSASGHVKPATIRTCFKCGKPGHIAIHCFASGNKNQATSGGATAERRVDKCIISTPSGTMKHFVAAMNSVPIPLNKASMRKYEDLEIPCESILVVYMWVDGTGINLRSKDRTIDFLPKTFKDLPIWYFDGFNTDQATSENSDTYIFPEVIYHDPFRRGSHILVLADTYAHNYQPTPTNYRKACTQLCEKAEVEEPWFGFNQEFCLINTDKRPLGWPPGGYPSPPGPYYCAVGANRIIARDMMEAFYRCCLYAGININGICAGSVPSQWNFQVGPRPGLRAADDLWMSRYILCRLAEEYGCVACFDAQPISFWPGNGCFCYYSTKEMRIEDGILAVERAIDKLARRHGAHINEYDAKNGADNALRLNGKQGMPHIRDFTAGVANRNCSVRIPRQVSEDKRGYLEDRRPAANADPYRVISIMLKTCIFDE